MPGGCLCGEVVPETSCWDAWGPSAGKETRGVRFVHQGLLLGFVSQGVPFVPVLFSSVTGRLTTGGGVGGWGDAGCTFPLILAVWAPDHRPFILYSIPLPTEIAST